MVTRAALLIVGLALGGAAIFGLSRHAGSQDRSVSPPVAPSATAIALGDSTNYSQGPYLAYAADWSVATGKLALTRGVDYSDTIFVEPSTFPEGTDMHWRWPGQPAKIGVYGYIHIAYGYYSGGLPKQQIEAKQVKDLGTLKTLFKVSTADVSGDINVLSETFLTHKARDFSTRAEEIGFLTELSNQGRIFFDKGRALGEWTDPSGVVWKVARQGDYCMFVPAKAPMNQGVLHYGAAIKWLKDRGELTGEEWFNGLAIGVEPVAGSGSMRLHQWQVDYR